MQLEEVFKDFWNGRYQTHEDVKADVDAHICPLLKLSLIEGKIQSKLAEVESLSSTAMMEPRSLFTPCLPELFERFWRMSFNSVLFDNITSTYKILCSQLLKCSRVLDDDYNTLFADLPSANDLKRLDDVLLKQLI